MRIKNFSILIFVLLICCIGAVSATEDNTIDNNLNEINTQDLISISNEESVSVEETASTENVLKSESTTHVVTNQNYKDYFDENNTLTDLVKDGDTLDLQGNFTSSEDEKFIMEINKQVNIISSTKDATFISTATDKISFNIVAGANYTNLSDIKFINTCVFVKGASHVTIDGITIIANEKGVGSGTGFASIHSNSYYTTVKNCYMENGGTGSSCLVLGKGGKYATFDNNVFNITGSSGNVLSSNIYVGTGDNPEFVNYTNNVINSQVAGSAFMYGITVCGQGNIIENNTLNNFKGNGIINQYGATSTKNIYRNNTITGGGSMAIGTYSIVENNKVQAVMTITEGCIATGNTVKGFTISGKHTTVKNNDINGTITISGTNTTFCDNNIEGTLSIAKAATNTLFQNNTMKGSMTVLSNNNTISGNLINTTGDYAIDLQTSENNTISNNVLVANGKFGNDAINGNESTNIILTNLGFKATISLVLPESINTKESFIIEVSVVDELKNPLNGKVVLQLNDGSQVSCDIVDGKGTINCVGSTPGSTMEFENTNLTNIEGYENVVLNAGSIKVNKLDSTIIAKYIVMTYNSNTACIVTLRDSEGNVIKNAKVNVIINGKTSILTTNSQGQIKITNSLVPKQYSVKISFAGNNANNKATKTVKITVKKATAKLTANSVTFKAKTKTKKYTVTLKNNAGKVMKNTKVTLKVNGKTYTATTNSKGQATFKITKLTKKGKYSAVISYAGNSYYNKLSKTVKITAK